MRQFIRSSTSSILLLRATTILHNRIISWKANQMTFITNSKRHASSRVKMKPNLVDTNAELTEIQLKQLALLSEHGKSGNESIDKVTSHITPFQRKVYRALCLVPEGYVTTYQSIGKYIQCDSYQAIGQALKRNPYAPMIPCHRVIKSNGTIGGFHGHTSGEYITKKISMLRNEGVSFLLSHSNVDVVVDPQCIFVFT